MIDPRDFLNPGAVLVRKQRDPDTPAWDRIVVCGFAEFDGGVVEVVVRPAEGFSAAIHADAEAIDGAYEVERDGQPERPFETSLEDALLRRDSTLTGVGDAERILSEERRDDHAEPALAVQAWRKFNEQQEEQR
jgi:hypothetical protein